MGYGDDLRKILSDAGFMNIAAIVAGTAERPKPPDAAVVGDMNVIVTYDVMHSEDALHVSISGGTGSSRDELLNAFAAEIGRQADSTFETHITRPVVHSYRTIRSKKWD
jgi:hypothetical protein